MNTVKYGKRVKFKIDLCDLQQDVIVAREKFQSGNFLEAIDIYEQLLIAYPVQAIDVLAELYDCYQLLPHKDRYNLYQARHYNFGIIPTDKVLDIGSGHLPFPLATHLSDVTFNNNTYGRAGKPFKHIHGKPVYECNVEDMPFPDKEFDFVYCSHVLEHVHNPEIACRELMRIAKRGYLETPAKVKDIFLNSAKTSNHRWWVEAVNNRLIFTEYTPDESEALQCNILMDMHCNPETKREKAFSALIYLKAPLVNTMFLWTEKFEYEVRRLSASHNKKSSIKPSVSEETSSIAEGNGKKADLLSEIYALVNQPHKDMDTLLPFAEKLIKANYHDEAEQLCNLLITQYGKSSDVSNLLGVINYRCGKLLEAKKQFETAYALDNNDKCAGINLAKILAKLGSASEANKVCDTLTVHFPKDEEIFKVISEIKEDTRINKQNHIFPTLKCKTLSANFFKKPETASLKFLQVHTFYQNYLVNLYNIHPGLAHTSFKEQINYLVYDGFSAIHMVAPYMGEFGYDSQLIIANNQYAQEQWLRENNMSIDKTHDWTREITRNQINTLKPDILYLTDPITFDSHFISSLSWKPKLVLGWRAANIPEGTDWSEFDVILSNLSALRSMALKLGARSTEHFFPGFPTWINEIINEVTPQYDVVFSGQWTLTQHPRRNKYLQTVARAASQPGKEFSCAFYLSGQTDSIPPEVAQYHREGQFGIAMHRALRTGKIALDARGILQIQNSALRTTTDLANKETANMRIFEVTGSGTFLLTEYHENLKQFFEPGIEIETFKDEKELIDKILYYLAHPDKREEIARKGQKRCLKEYSIQNRAKELDNIIHKYISSTSVSNQHHTMKDTVNRNDITACIQNAVKEIKAGHFETAFEFLNRAKSLKLPTPGIDYLRAACFIKLGQHHSAREALQEELRYFPNNSEANNLLTQIIHQYPQTSTMPCIDNEFNTLLQVIRPYTMLSEERLFSLFSLTKRVCEQNIPGNFVECGVAAGGSAALLAYVIKKYSKQPRWLYAFDCFDGMPFPTEYDQHNGQAANATGWGAGTCAAPEDSVKNICAKLGVSDILKTVKGDFRDTLPKMRDTAGMIAFLHMDGDWYESTKVILHNLYDRVVNYGLIQIDDYGYWEGCKKAIHEYETIRNVKFELSKIDGTGVWFQKPDKFPVNTVVASKIIDEFHNDDPAPKGLLSQMSINERFQLYYAIRNYLSHKSSPLRFVEVGSYAGASLFLIYMALKKITPLLQGFAIEPGGQAQLNDVLKVIGGEVIHLSTASQQAAPYLQQLFEKNGNSAKMIFIDGDHTYEGVKQDILCYFPLLAPGGMMIFHDYLPPLDDKNRESILFQHGGKEPGIRQACQELMENTYHCEVIHIPLLYPTDPTQTQAHLPIIPGVFSTIRVYRKPINTETG